MSLESHWVGTRLGLWEVLEEVCSCLESPRDGGAWWAAVYGVAQSRTRLKRLSSSRGRIAVEAERTLSVGQEKQENVGHVQKVSDSPVKQS